MFTQLRLLLWVKLFREDSYLKPGSSRPGLSAAAKKELSSPEVDFGRSDNGRPEGQLSESSPPAATGPSERTEGPSIGVRKDSFRNSVHHLSGSLRNPDRVSKVSPSFRPFFEELLLAWVNAFSRSRWDSRQVFQILNPISSQDKPPVVSVSDLQS